MNMADKILFTESLPGPYFDNKDLNWTCTCPARDDSSMMHSKVCGITPIFADLARQSPKFIWDSYTEYSWELGYRTLIKCATCGRERYGKDMDVIYEAPLNFTHGGGSYKYPSNLVKAICPSHNRKGTISFQGVPPSGY